MLPNTSKTLIVLLILLECLNHAQLAEDTCEKENCDSKEPKECRRIFERENFTSRNKSIWVIESKGRLGNHLITYTIIQAFEKELNIQPYILQETYDYVTQYFSNVTVPILQEEFCNYSQMDFETFDDDIKELTTNEKYRTGHILNIWPFGYLPNAKECCPGAELQKYIQTNFLDRGYRHLLTFHPRFQDHANDLKQRAAKKIGISDVNKITFVGVHNRRTDFLEYMTSKFGVTKNPYTKSYFTNAMDYFREENDHVAFFFVSDDMEWGRKNIKNRNKDIFFVGKGDTDDPDAIGYDLSLLSSCNHTIITWGSFSMWAALLSGGEYFTQYGVIVPKHLQAPKKKRRRK